MCLIRMTTNRRIFIDKERLVRFLIDLYEISIDILTALICDGNWVFSLFLCSSINT